MKQLLLSLTLLWAAPLSAQLLDALALDSVRTYRSLERALKEPQLVYRLDLSGAKLKEFPPEIRQLTNLNALDLSGNKLKELPDWITELVHLQELRLSRNKFGSMPAALCRLRHLKRLDMSRNAITGLPECVGRWKELVSLDLWSNDIAIVPEDIKDMPALRFLDLRAIMFEQDEMDRIQELVPKAKVYFSPPCNCGM
jgi:Leucine-rich repeat (LRR) protein